MKAGTGIRIFVVVSLAVVALTYATFSLTGQVALKASVTEGFSKCVAGKAILYGHRNSRDTIAQTGAFGASARNLNYVECSPLSSTYGECIQSGISTFPTWVINGKRYEGVLQLEELSKLTGCRL